MPWEALAEYLKLPVFALVAARLGGLLMFQPVLGALAIPTPIRALLVVGLAALLTPFVRLPAEVPDTAAGIALAMGGEVLLGAMLGLVTVACFVGVQLGGLLIAQESGVAFGQVVDPTTDDEETIHGMFYLQLAIVVYLIVGGHRALIAACLDTFETFPLLSSVFTAQSAVDALTQMLATSGHVAFRVAGPTLLALFLVDVALGFVSRTMPQLNILAVGFSLKSLVGFAIMAVSLPPALDAFVSVLEEAFKWVRAATG